MWFSPEAEASGGVAVRLRVGLGENASHRQRLVAHVSSTVGRGDLENYGTLTSLEEGDKN